MEPPNCYILLRIVWKEKQTCENGLFSEFRRTENHDENASDSDEDNRDAIKGIWVAEQRSEYKNEVTAVNVDYAWKISHRLNTQFVGQRD